MKRAVNLILLGVGIGILVAPRKGTETWSRLKKAFADWKNQMTDKADDIVSESNDILEKGKSIANNISNESNEPVTGEIKEPVTFS